MHVCVCVHMYLCAFVCSDCVVDACLNKNIFVLQVSAQQVKESPEGYVDKKTKALYEDVKVQDSDVTKKGEYFVLNSDPNIRLVRALCACCRTEYLHRQMDPRWSFVQAEGVVCALCRP